MRKFIRGSVWVLALSVLGFTLTWGRPDLSIRGFFPAEAAREAEFEKIFRAVPTPERAQQDLWVLTQAPHVAGTPEDYETARKSYQQSAVSSPQLIIHNSEF